MHAKKMDTKELRNKVVEIIGKTMSAVGALENGDANTAHDVDGTTLDYIASLAALLTDTRGDNFYKIQSEEKVTC